MSNSISENKEKFERKLGQIRTDPDYSTEAKRRYLGEAYAEARDEHERLTAQHREQTAKKLSDLERPVLQIQYPLGTLESEKEIVRMSYRDAFDRAEKAARTVRKEPTALKDLLERAEISGDEQLADAVYHVATRRGNRDVADKYLEPRKEAALNWRKLSEARKEADSLEHQLFGWMPPMKPQELNGMAAPGERFDEVR